MPVRRNTKCRQMSRLEVKNKSCIMEPSRTGGTFHWTRSLLRNRKQKNRWLDKSCWMNFCLRCGFDNFSGAVSPDEAAPYAVMAIIFYRHSNPKYSPFKLNLLLKSRQVSKETAGFFQRGIIMSRLRSFMYCYITPQ